MFDFVEVEHNNRMHTALAFLNGRFISAAEMMIPAYDAGFVLGATVSEQLRTFGGKLFRVDEHLARLRRGLEITGIEPDCTLEQLAAWAEELAAENHKLLDPADDLGLSIFITPGPYGAFAPAGVARRPTIGMSTYPLPFHLWADKYEAGDTLRISHVHQVPAASWPPELKCRSRMHYYLADREVRKTGDGARPLLLDEDGFLNETPTANIVWYVAAQPTPGDSEYLGAVSPNKALGGISQAALLDYAGRFLGLWHRSAELRPSGVKTCAEFMLTSTPFCVLPVVSIDGQPIGDGRPGPTFKKLLAAWSVEVGLDIAGQASRFATR